jgi:ribosomal protein S12 methylthiotransferase
MTASDAAGDGIKIGLRAYISTMGCPKNLVDSEAAASVMASAGCEITADPSSADVLLVGACSFLDSSWRDTVEEINRLAAIKRAGNGGWLVLMGCLPKHRGDDLEGMLPDVDYFLPTGAHERLAGLVQSWREERDGGIPPGSGNAGSRTVDCAGADRFAAFEDRILFTPSHTAYVKIAEGCNRRCSFCAIPAIRGRQHTRPAASIVREVEGLVERGVKEITLLSQDVVSYRDGGRRFVDLVDEIVNTGIEWIRVFYLHPSGLELEDVERLFRHESVVRYLEVPVQHASNRVLEAMRRGHDRPHVERLVAGIRSRFPEAVIRSEVIVGFPGETERDFEELLEFVEEIGFDSLGFFPYSREPGTEAAALGGIVPERIVRQRVEELNRVQEAISFGVQAGRVGETYTVLVDRKCEPFEDAFADADASTGAHAGRFYGQAPEIDGEVFVATDDVVVGEFARVRITESGVFDLKGTLLRDSSA